MARANTRLMQRYMRIGKKGLELKGPSYGAETVDMFRQLEFKDDFIFDSVPLTIWNVDCENGDGTATWSSDYSTGVYVLDIAADAGGEAYAQLKGSDMSPISLYRHKPIFEIRASGNSLESGVVATAGLRTGVAATSPGVWFSIASTGALTLHVYESGDVSYSAGNVNTSWNIYRLDFTDPSHVKFYVNGLDALPNSHVVVSSALDTQYVYPHARLYRASGSGLGTALVDYVALGWDRFDTVSGT